jgi:hypothetical protein
MVPRIRQVLGPTMTTAVVAENGDADAVKFSAADVSADAALDAAAPASTSTGKCLEGEKIEKKTE